MFEIRKVEPYDQVQAAHIRGTIKNCKALTINLLLLCIVDYTLYRIFYNTTTAFWLDIWIIISCLFFICCWLVTYRCFKPGTTYNLTWAHYWLQFISLMSGLIIASGILLVNFYLIHVSPSLSLVHTLTLSTLLYVITNIICLTYLTQNLYYFFLLFIPTIIPLFIVQFIYPLTHYPLFFVAYNFILLVFVYSAFASYKNKQRNLTLLFKNQTLKRKAEQQLKKTTELCQQLQLEMNKSKTIEKKLHIHNQLLEQKVKERISDIKTMNRHLESNVQKLKLVHEIAGIHPWYWNIEQRSIELTTAELSKVTKDWKLHQKYLEDIVHPDDLASVKRALYLHLRGYTSRFDMIMRIQQDGRWYWVQEVGQVILRHPKTKIALRMIGIRRDISQEKKDQDRLKLAASVVEQAAEGIFVLDENFCYIDTNPYFEHLTGFTKQQLLGKHIFHMIANRNIKKDENYTSVIIKQLLRTGEFDGEMSEQLLSGRKLSITVHINAVKNESGQVINYIGIVSDQTERKIQEQRLFYLENYDTLTNLPNRFYYNYQLHQYLNQRPNPHKNLAILRLNIDRFRALNEFLTNTGGDELLRDVAHRLRLNTTEALLVAHLNGDEFAIIYENLKDCFSIEKLCLKILDSFTEPFHVKNQEFFITVSIGVAFYPEHGLQVDSLNNHVEQALNDAKRLGGNTHCYYSPEKAALVAHDGNLERELRQAIKNHELAVYYQPKVYAKNHQIYGFEALIRWNHPTRGIINPDQFIPLAQETSLISDIGRFVLMETAKQICIWNNLGFHHICVSVNVVAQQIHRGQLLNDIDDAMQHYEIDGEQLELEITESSLMENSKIVQKMLLDIKQHGILISLDDFGTGYSSLAYLTDYPIDILKIDHRFIAKIGQQKQNAIVSAMIAMGKAMNLTMVAEGVERQEQADFLQQQKCDILQGFLFSKPLTAADSTLFLQTHQ